jgi:hypothetical protein
MLEATLFVQPLRRNGLADFMLFRLKESHESDHAGENNSGENPEHDQKTNETRHEILRKALIR